MTSYKADQNLLFIFFRNKRFDLAAIKKIRIFCFLIAVISCAHINQVKAQDDSSSDLSDEELTDTTKTENGFDTTGYYFNRKESKEELYTNQKVNSRISSDTTIRCFRNDDDFWYVKSVEKFRKDAERLRYDRRYRDSLSKASALPPDEQDFTEEPSGKEWYLQPWLRNAIWIALVSIFVAAVIYFLLSNKINLFSRQPKRIFEREAATEDDFRSANYDTMLSQFITDKNYRLAVRVLYLQLLKILTERSIISYQPQFTNTQYLQQLFNTPLYKDFFKVTRHYEYIWYGEFKISEEAFRKVQIDFETVKQGALRK